jgi:hypothetical protein
MTPLTALTALVFAMSGEIEYPAICKDTYLSEEKAQNIKNVVKALSRKPGCMQIGNETITEGDRAGKVFPIYTCCTSIETERK